MRPRASAAEGTVDPCVDACLVGLAAYPKGNSPDFGYGTAGFRAKADGLDHIMYRMGLLAAIRSKALGGKAIGVMVTASHNPECDNGVKLVEPMGEMLPIEWEAKATLVANASDQSLGEVLKRLMEEVDADANIIAKVVVGRDTRKSSPHLALAVLDGAGALQPAVTRSLGLATTPQLHYVMRCLETNGGYGRPTLSGYCDKMVAAFASLTACGAAEGSDQTATTATTTPAAAESKTPKYVPELVVDCANGVGASALGPLVGRLKEAGLNINLKNTGEGALNSGCGADFVKLKQQQPANVDTSSIRGASLDGDADRLVYYYGGDGAKFKLLDGDRLALLFAHYVAQLMKEGGLSGPRLGLVQTAYANGASTAYAKSVLGEENVLCAKTGVKHCHHAALALDIGIYFEANGHGTILFSDNFVAWAVAECKKPGPGGVAAKKLMLFREVINEAVGDAISGLLAVEACLKLLDWSCEDWLARYDDLPNRQIKVAVKDRFIFETADAERRCVQPEGLQAEIDKLVAGVPLGRAFVRPSGTEDVVRVYVEAATVDETLKLGQAVVDLVFTRAAGVGSKPVVS